MPEGVLLSISWGKNEVSKALGRKALLGLRCRDMIFDLFLVIGEYKSVPSRAFEVHLLFDLVVKLFL